MTETLKILMILTSHAFMGDASHPTGVWFEEMAAPYYVFTDAGAEVTIVSIAGGKVPIDPRSLEGEDKNPQTVNRFLKDTAAMQKAENSKNINDVNIDNYDAVFLPGGHGTMWDLPESDVLAKLLTAAWAKGKIVSAVCHGPAGLVNVKDTNDQPLVAGRKVAGFTNSEEESVGLADKVPFLLETRLRELGAKYESGPDFAPYAVQDGNLITGQNPASSDKTAQLILKQLQQKNPR